MTRFNVPPSWQKLVLDIQRDKGIVMILGGVDAGKTFLSHYLVKELVSVKSGRNGIVTVLVDGDIGQSTIGPPATVGVAIFKKEVPGDFDNIKPSFMRFVGSTSPVGHLLQTLLALKNMVDKAIQLEAEVVVLDTTGFITGDIARELKYQKIDLIKPRHIVALAWENELEDIIKPFLGKKDLHIHHLTPADGVRIKTQSERQKNRERKFNCYFKDAEIKEFKIDEFGIHGMIPKSVSLKGTSLSVLDENRIKNLLIAFCDQHQDVLALGIIEEFNSRDGKIKVRTPLKSMESVNSIQFGTLAIEVSGEQV